MKQIAIATVLFAAFCLLTGMSLFKGKQYYLASFEGKVIDADTKEPIEGAVVLAVYHRSTISVAGSNHYAFDAQETITDTNGEFKITSKTVNSTEISGKPKGKLVIFKPGYGTFPDHKQSNAIGENKSWPPSEKHIMYELPKLESIEERKNNVIWMHKYIKPLYLHAINEERNNLGLSLIEIPEEEISK